MDRAIRTFDQARARIAQLEDALTVLRDACGHCIAAGNPPTTAMMNAADAALRGDWQVTP